MMSNEEMIVYCAVQGTAKHFSSAIAIMRTGDFNRRDLLKLGQKHRATGRLCKALWVAEGLASGKLQKSDRIIEIRRLAASAGHPVKHKSI